MLPFKFLCLTIFISYAFLLFVFITGWIRLKRFKEQTAPPEYPFADILVACRNESKSICRLICDLKSIDYPKASYMVHLVDDHSEDGTIEEIKTCIDRYDNFELLKLPDNRRGKKAALDYGLEYCKGEIIFFTDADCRVSKRWLRDTISYYLGKNKPEMIIGLTDQDKPNGLFRSFQYLDFISLVGATIGSAALQLPFMCNGANLAVKNSIFKDSDIFRNKLTSGDDVFLLHNLKRDKTKNVQVLKPVTPLVTTKPEPDFKSLLNQRVRWASKSKYYTDSFSIIVALLILVTNFSFIAVIFYFWIKTEFVFLLVLVSLKVGAEILFFAPILYYFRLSRLLVFLPVVEIIHPFYIIYTAFSGILKKPFHWKGRVLDQ